MMTLQLEMQENVISVYIELKKDYYPNAWSPALVGQATFFGDANDKESLVSELIGQPNVMRLKEEMGTEPKVYYLM